MATNYLSASEIKSGDNLFGAGIVTSVIALADRVHVTVGERTLTLDPDEEVTVDRA